MDAVESLLLEPPFGPAMLAVSAVLVLSFVGAPWLETARTDVHAPSLIDRWKLFSWVHPVWAWLLKWSAILILGAMVCIPVFRIAPPDRIISSVGQALDTAFQRVWRPR